MDRAVSANRQAMAGLIATTLLPEAPNLLLKMNRAIKLIWSAKETAVSRTILSIEELQEFLYNVTNKTTVTQLEENGIKVFFRGTTRNADGLLFPGNPNSIANGISTSTDPIVATIFATESAFKNKAYKGILQIALPENLNGLKLSAPNTRVSYELEVIFNTSADTYSKLSTIEITVEDAQRLVKEVYGVDISKKIGNGMPGNSAEEITRELNHSTLEQSYEFYKKAINYNIKK